MKRMLPFLLLVGCDFGVTCIDTKTYEQFQFWGSAKTCDQVKTNCQAGGGKQCEGWDNLADFQDYCKIEYSAIRATARQLYEPEIVSLSNDEYAIANRLLEESLSAAPSSIAKNIKPRGLLYGMNSKCTEAATALLKKELQYLYTSQWQWYVYNCERACDADKICENDLIYYLVHSKNREVKVLIYDSKQQKVEQIEIPLHADAEFGEKSTFMRLKPIYRPNSTLIQSFSFEVHYDNHIDKMKCEPKP